MELKTQIAPDAVRGRNEMQSIIGQLERLQLPHSLYYRPWSSLA